MHAHGFAVDFGDRSAEDNAQSTQEALSWVEGPPEKSFWGSMKTKGRRKLTVYAWRCPGCAQVRLFAPER